MISISIWICNPVWIYRRKINDDADDKLTNHSTFISLYFVPCIFYYMYNEQTNADWTDSFYCTVLYHSYMFQHQCVILRELSLGAC